MTLSSPVMKPSSQVQSDVDYREKMQNIFTFLNTEAWANLHSSILDLVEFGQNQTNGNGR